MDATDEITGRRPRQRGEVASLKTNDDGTPKGYGFIRVYTDGGRDYTEYYMHRRSFGNPEKYDALRVGDRVEFEPADTKKGLRAIHVEKV